MKSFKTWLRRHNPKRLENDANKASKIALDRKSPASVRRALNLVAAREAEKSGDNYNRKERIQRAVNRHARVLGAGGGWDTRHMDKYASVADSIAEGKALEAAMKAMDKAFSPEAMADMKRKREEAQKNDPKFQEWQKNRERKAEIDARAKKAGDDYMAKREARRQENLKKHKEWLADMAKKKKEQMAARKK